VRVVRAQGTSACVRAGVFGVLYLRTVQGSWRQTWKSAVSRCVQKVPPSSTGCEPMQVTPVTSSASKSVFVSPQKAVLHACCVPGFRVQRNSFLFVISKSLEAQLNSHTSRWWVSSAPKVGNTETGPYQRDRVEQTTEAAPPRSLAESWTTASSLSAPLKYA
jgi:hypothetical protein